MLFYVIMSRNSAHQEFYFNELTNDDNNATKIPYSDESDEIDKYDSLPLEDV